MNRVCALLMFLLPCAGVRADTANVEKAMSVLDFDITRMETSGAKDAGLTALDLDGDGQVSKAEAAGNSEVTLGFDRADRNRNGRISTAEWQRYEKSQERVAKAREARLARGKKESRESASAGVSRPKPPHRDAP